MLFNSLIGSPGIVNEMNRLGAHYISIGDYCRSAAPAPAPAPAPTPAPGSYVSNSNMLYVICRIALGITEAQCGLTMFTLLLSIFTGVYDVYGVYHVCVVSVVYGV